MDTPLKSLAISQCLESGHPVYVCMSVPVFVCAYVCVCVCVCVSICVCRVIVSRRLCWQSTWLSSSCLVSSWSSRWQPDNWPLMTCLHHRASWPLMTCVHCETTQRLFDHSWPMYTVKSPGWLTTHDLRTLWNHSAFIWSVMTHVHWQITRLTDHSWPVYTVKPLMTS